MFNLDDGAGLTDVLAGAATVADVLQVADPGGSGSEGSRGSGGGGELGVLAAGSIPPNPSELLGSERMSTLMRELAQDALVLIDSPPLLPVTDAAILAASTDGAIVVARAGRVTIPQLEHALEDLRAASGRCLGVVVNAIPKGADAAQHYYTVYEDGGATGAAAGAGVGVGAGESTGASAAGDAAAEDVVPSGRHRARS